MKGNLVAKEVSSKEWFSLNQFLHTVKKIDSECISVYYPYGKGKQTISLLEETKRKESLEKIESAIEKRIQKLRQNPSSVGKFTKTLCIFGWLKDGKAKTVEVGTSKKLPYIYMASKKPHIKPFQDILKTSYRVLVITLDQKSARIQKFVGNQVMQESKIRIDLQGRHKKGGQSQGRFLRARQTKIHVFFKKVAAKAREMDSSSEIILLGGNGPGKNEFYDQLDSKLAKKCLVVEGLSFSSAINDIQKKIIHCLYQQRKKFVANIISKYENLVKDGLTAKSNDMIYKALESGAVDTLIVSVDYHKNAQFKKIMRMLEIAQNTGAVIEFAAAPKILEKLEINNSVLAILRYKVR